ncbi:MAG: hypothetical protein L0Z73_08385 [Gammaproteobacteria bacterium]|nr:hypothetical protein [Gammaproteobacteria bacterium]
MAMLSKFTKISRQGKGARRYMSGSLWVTIGYILSPLSWWNDMVINVPLAYVFSIPFAYFDERLFLPAFVTGYWLTNLLGFILMHKGVAGFLNKQGRKTRLWIHLAVASLYTLLILLLVWLEWIPMPAPLFNKPS